MLNQRLLQTRQQSYSYAEAPPVNLTSRNYVLGPSVNPYTSTMFMSESRKPFTEKIDYLKVLDNLRRTNSSQTIDGKGFSLRACSSTQRLTVGRGEEGGHQFSGGVGAAAAIQRFHAQAGGREEVARHHRV